MSVSSSMQVGASALGVHSWGMAIGTHNVANVNTDAFEPQRAHYADAPQDRGVRLNAVSQGDGLARSPGQDTVSGVFGGDSLSISPSGTDLAREMTSMISTQRSFEANAVVVRTADDMLGTVLDIRA
ncbi:MAG: flagellar basal-body rod protein [Desulfovibrio sp.]|nr:flagellar basal-body rod protein [Desulfovibrio sp.]